MKSNFEFLKDSFPVLANFGELAEKYLYSDSNSWLMQLGMVGETIVNLIFTYDRIPLPHVRAVIMALDRVIRHGGNSGSVYDERGILSFKKREFDT